MIDNIRKHMRRWLFLGALATAGCAGTVTQEEFLAQNKNTETAIRTLKEQISEAQKRELDAHAHRDQLVKHIEDINARLSVSSLDSYAVAVEEQATQHARRYAHVARTLASLQKKEWDLEADHSDTKTVANSLTAKLAEFKKTVEDDYKALKDKNVQETSERQKRLEAFEASLKNLANTIQKLEKRSDPSKLEPGAETTYTASAAVQFSDTATHDFAQEYLRVFIEYRKVAGKPVPDSKEAQAFYFSTLAGDNNTVEMSELEAEVTRLQKNVAQLRENTGNEHEELTMRKITFGKEDTYHVSIEIKLAPEQEKRITELVTKYNPRNAYLVYALKLNSADGKMTKENVDQLEEFLQTDYSPQK